MKNELTQRIITASVLGALTLYLLFESVIGFSAFVAIGSLVAGYEFAKLNKMKPATLWPVLMLIVVFFYIIAYYVNTAYLNPHGNGLYYIPFFFIVFISTGASIVFWLKNLFLVINYPSKKPSNSKFNKALSLFLLIMPLVLLPLLQMESSSAIVLLLLLIVWGADSCAYFSGKAFGKHKLAPKLSSGKTIEGVVGGVIGAVFITFIWMLITDNLLWQFIPIALITALFSVVGDLYESVYKREAGVKDSGNILPGHGGLLDRIDGLLAATPIFITTLAISGI